MISLVLPYFRTHLDALGYREHKDTFNTANIGAQILNKSYHLEVGEITRRAMENYGPVVNVPVSARLFYRGTRTPNEARDLALTDGQRLIERALNAANRAANGNLLNIELTSMNVLPLDDSNDNSMISTINFLASVAIDVQ